MYLKYIRLFSDDSVGDKKYCSDFDYHTYVMRYYLYQCLRKDKYVTDGSFDCINIVAVRKGHEETFSYNSTFDIISYQIEFDFEYYDSAEERDRCHYCIEVYKKALLRIAKYKAIPYERIVVWLNELEAKDYIDTWKFRNMLIREYGLRIHFTACLTTSDFTIRADVYRKLNEPPICGGIVVRTKPDSIHFNHIIKKFPIEGNRLYICDRWNDRFFSLDLNQLAAGNFELHICQSIDIRADDIELFQSLQKSLMYDGNDFDL